MEELRIVPRLVVRHCLGVGFIRYTDSKATRLAVGLRITRIGRIAYGT